MSNTISFPKPSAHTVQPFPQQEFEKSPIRNPLDVLADSKRRLRFIITSLMGSGEIPFEADDLYGLALVLWDIRDDLERLENHLENT